MFNPQQIRNRRLSNDYQEMLNIKGDIVHWVAVHGEAPYVEEYELHVYVRSIVSQEPEFRSVHKFRVILPENYPQAPPQIDSLDTPSPYHPNWYKNARWCFGTWEMSEGLGHHVIRMIRTLQYDPEITNPNSPANYDANDWYLDSNNSKYFPTDLQLLPDPTKTASVNAQNTQSTSSSKPLNRFKINGLSNDSSEEKTNDSPPEPPKSRFRFN